ncbi:MAG: hypothetical protein HQL99_12565 [Magnetococcales bacterium]|nr:hypothetical protein [Magnetococcales bacterium]
MSLKRALIHHQYTFFFPMQMPIGGKLARAEEKIAEQLAALPLTRTPDVEDRQIGLERVIGHIQETGTLSGLSRKDLKRMPWFLFEDLGDGRTLADDPGVLRQWGEWLDANPGSGTVSALVHNVLLNHPQDGQLAFWKKLIEKHLARSRQPNLVVWKQRCERFHLLDPDGPQRLAETLYRGEATYYEFCQAAGLSGDLARNGFVRKGLDRLLVMMGRYADSNGLQTEQLQSLLNGFRDQQGRFLQIVSGFTTRLAEVLLRPFQDREAETRLRNLLRDFLIKNLGDPRTHPAAWHAVDPKARQVIMQWLVGRPARIDDKLWMFVQEANKQMVGLENDLYQLKHRLDATPLNVLHQSIQRLNAIMGVAEFFNLFEVIQLCQAMEAILIPFRDKTVPMDLPLIDALIVQHGRLQDAIRDVPGYVFHSS